MCILSFQALEKAHPIYCPVNPCSHVHYSMSAHRPSHLRRSVCIKQNEKVSFRKDTWQACSLTMCLYNRPARNRASKSPLAQLISKAQKALLIQKQMPQQRYYPQCVSCSQKQSAAVRSGRRKLIMHYSLPRKSALAGLSASAASRDAFETLGHDLSARFRELRYNPFPSYHD